MEYRQDAIIEDLDVEHLLKIKKIKDNPKYQFIMNQIGNEAVLDKIFKFVAQNIES